MAPKWLQRHDDSGKRISVFSTIANSRRDAIDNDEAVPPIPTQFSNVDQVSTPPADDSLTRERPTTGHRSLSRKRYSFFARSPAFEEITEPLPTPSTQDEPGRSYFDHDEDVDQRRLTFYRKRSSKYFKPRSENSLRWIHREGSDSRPATASQAMDNATEQDSHHAMKKASISAPFNFQHITHTQHKELPKLDAVDDRDLMVKFLAASAQQLPQSDLRGIHADSLDSRSELVSPAVSRPTSPRSQSSPTLKFSNGPFARFTEYSTLRHRSMTTSSNEDLNHEFHLPRQRSRSTLRSRSASLASLVAEQRSPPTMVHPAFRDQSEASSATSSPHNSLSPVMQQNLASESSRFLDVVTEEREDLLSPASPNKRFQRRASSDAHTLLAISPQPEDNTAKEVEELEDQQVSEEARTSSLASCDTSDVSGLRKLKSSIPSLCSGDSWEEDVDYCYNVEAESTCQFEWTGDRLAECTPGPHDSVLPMPCKTFAQDASDVSPRTSIAHHQRQKSSLTLSNLLPVVRVEEHWGVPEAFENPRTAPIVPPAEITRLSLFDVPLIHTPITLSPLFKIGRPDWTTKSSLVTLDDSVIPDRRPSDALPQQESLLAPITAVKGHVRAKSAGTSDNAELAQKLSQRWSFIPPSRIPASAVPSDKFSKVPALPVRPASQGPPSPPPNVPLPPIPQSAKTLSALKRRTIASGTENNVIMRRPQTSADRSLLQAAGRTVQRERSSRPASPSRLCHTPTPSHPSLRDLMGRAQSTPNVAQDLADEVLVAPRAFPQWI